MNLPNKLTLSRFAMTAAFLAVIFSHFKYHQTIALALFSVASFTDFLDGKIARDRNLVTNFGILADPLADKILTSSAFIAFVGLKLMPAWMVVVIVARELGITGLRLLAATKGVVLAAEGYGKHKTISQIVAIIAILVMVSYGDWGALGKNIFGLEICGRAWVVPFAEISKWISVGLTMLSGSLYLWRNRSLYLSDL